MMFVFVSNNATHAVRHTATGSIVQYSQSSALTTVPGTSSTLYHDTPVEYQVLPSSLQYPTVGTSITYTVLEYYVQYMTDPPTPRPLTRTPSTSMPTVDCNIIPNRH